MKVYRRLGRAEFEMSTVASRAVRPCVGLGLGESASQSTSQSAL